uniref:START domain-containing protein n=1 Tax=Picea sitchensis TaxID=3332 RepID=A9NPZ4_PICSI|nr:unknown [Picea sitchensis]
MLSKYWGFRADCMHYSFQAKALRRMGSVEQSRAWSVSDDSLKRYVLHASESCVQDLLISATATGGDSKAEGWKVLGVGEDEIEISRRWSGAIPMLRGRRILRGTSPSQFQAVASAIDTAKQWDPNLAEGRYIKDLHENLSIIRLRFSESSKPLFKNREFIVYERREAMEDGTLVVAVASLPNEIAKGLLPKSRGKFVRGLLIQSGWVIESLEQNNSCMVTHVVQLDPAGWLPKWVVKRLSIRLVMIIDGLSKLVDHSISNDFHPSK